MHIKRLFSIKEEVVLIANRKFIKFGVMITLALQWTLPAYALPGQNIRAVINWSENNPIISKLTYSSTQYEKGEPDYYSKVDFPGQQSTLTFNVWVNCNGIITSENIDYRSQDKNNALEFKKDNSNGIRLIQQIYGQSIAEEFRTSEYVTRINESQFYKGRRFGYQTWNDSNDGIYHFTIIPLKDLETNIKQWKYCTTHSCS